MQSFFSRTSLLVITISIFVALFTCNHAFIAHRSVPINDTTPAMDKRLPENALKGLVIANGLEVTTMATEPMLKNPTNIDVDERGRVWVTEAYNYRPAINGNPVNPEGDRILVLEDKNGDGVMDVSKVFYQGPEINAPLGVCVLGNRVLVSQSPYVWAFFDDNGDDKADRKEILFQGMGGEQHDHGMHTFLFGPDGKLYFNFGNEGRTLKDKDGKVVRDQDGDEIGPAKYREGMLFRCNPDGSQVECLGHNFRNNYEPAVDSYGNIWQSDNDDDGNRGVRINYILEYGNYGYKDEITGASWQSGRTNMEDSIPYRHWHLNDPGVVPNLLQTGSGSPTGMVMYEGTLLPESFQNQVIHCDPGPNVVRAYPVKKQGAGYSASIINLLKGENDQWFRPADICVAPDGSLIVADWYDPGVGGHQAGDQQRGRIYRIAPTGSRYSIPTQDYSTAGGAIKALQSPNLAVRHHAWNTLQQMGAKAIPELEQLWRSGSNPRMRARAFWALVKMPGGEKYVLEAAKESNPDFRTMALKAARQLNKDVIPLVKQLVNDQDLHVKRECIIALRHNSDAAAPALWTTLAKGYDGKDRWYLEALGIAADRQWDTFFQAFVDDVKDPLQNPAHRDIIWRARTDKAIPYLATLASNDSEQLKSRLKYFRAFDFNQGTAKSAHLVKMLDKTNRDLPFTKLVLNHLDPVTMKQSPVAQQSLKEVLTSVEGTAEYLEFVRKYELASENAKLFDMAVNRADGPLGRNAAGLLLQLKGGEQVRKLFASNDTAKMRRMVTALARVGSKESIQLLESLAFSADKPDALKKYAAEMMGRSQSGEDRVLELLKSKKAPQSLIPSMVNGVRTAWRKSIYLEASTYLPGAGKPVAKTATADFAKLTSIKGNPTSGRTVFKNLCAVCHQVGKDGFDFGPKLTEIGSKLAKESMYEAIAHPSAGISFGFETWQLEMKDGSKLTGIIGSKTETDIDLKLPGGVVQKLKASDVKSMKQLPESMMPAGLHEAISTKELADLMAYLSSLKKKPA
jgi:putative membrane-bound dehydrogenase-like protein